MQKSFSFKGLTLNSDNLLVADGECMELVNLRYGDGALFPIPAALNETELKSVYDKFYWHPSAEMFLGIEQSDSRTVHFYNKDLEIVAGSDGSNTLFPLLVGVERIEFTGNIVCCITATTTYYLIFDSGSYRWLGEAPQMPTLTFTVNSVVFSVKTKSSYNSSVSLDNLYDESYWNNASKGFFDECLTELHSKGYYVDRALFRFALRMFDGNYLCYSPIYYIDDDNSVSDLRRDDGNFYFEKLDPLKSSCQYRVKVQGFMPTFNFADVNLGDWENIIVGIDVFTSGSIYGHKIKNSTDTWDLRGTYYTTAERSVEQYVKKSCSELLNDILAVSMFYKVAEYNIKGALVDSVKDVSLSALALCINIPDDDGTSVRRSAVSSYFYNGRLHLAGLRESLFKAYGHCDYLPAGGESVVAGYVAVVTKLKTSSGVSVVKKEYHNSFALGVKEGAYFLTPYIMYPDSRACEMTFIIEIDSVIYRKTFVLQKHRLLNIAYYVQAYGDGKTVTLVGHIATGTAPVVSSAENIKEFFSYQTGEYLIHYVDGEGWYYGEQKFELPGSAYRPMFSMLGATAGDTITVIIADGNEQENLLEIKDIELNYTWDKLDARPNIDEVNACEVRGNVMKVSAVDNPFYFPAKNTYSPSHDDIIAVCSNTTALSQGQFGQHPLYLFCKDGIWAMSSDASGSIAYASALPLSREVCINAASLCCVDSGVVFVSPKGVMLLQGGQLACLSNTLHSDNSPVTEVAQSAVFNKIAALSGNATLMSGDDISFKDYIKNAIIGFVASEKELWVSNKECAYTYVFSLENRYWTKVNRGYIAFTNCYPHIMACTAVNERSRISVIHKDYAADYAPVLLVTRPQLWGTKLPKRIVQFMLHASVKVAASHAPDEYGGVGCYLLCSNDGVHFKLLGGVENNCDFNDMVFPYFPSQSYKYYVIALSGTMSVGSRIAGAELTIECVWNNRLR